jgi:hypothetical protein
LDLIGNSAVTIRDYGTIVHKRKHVLELMQRGFPTNRPPQWLALYGYLQFSWEENLVAPLIAAPYGKMRKWEDKGTEHKCLAKGYMCNCNAKEITILFCKQIRRSPNTSYAKCRMGLRGGKMEMAGGTALVPALFLCLKLPVGRR